jgi:hypothetical protein
LLRLCGWFTITRDTRTFEQAQHALAVVEWMPGMSRAEWVVILLTISTASSIGPLVGVMTTESFSPLTG